MIKRILVPVDFSEGSLESLGHAVDLAKRYDGQLLLLHVLEPFYSAMRPIEVIVEQKQFARTELTRLAEKLGGQGVTCRTLLRTGTPYLEIVHAARENNADVIVMATHGRTGFSHLMIGSVAERVVRTSVCPVLTVRCGEPATESVGKNSASGLRSDARA